MSEEAARSSGLGERKWVSKTVHIGEILINGDCSRGDRWVDI